MRQNVNLIRQLLDESTEQDRADWKSHAHTILGAISKSHPTRRGVQAGIAAAFLDNVVLREVEQRGWTRRLAPARRGSFDFAINKDEIAARILIATLQLEGGKPKRARIENGHPPVYLARLPQRSTRKGSSRIGGQTEMNAPRKRAAAQAFSFEEFDVLAVSMQPLTRNWSDFRYSLARTLTASRENPALLARTQEVPVTRSRLWTCNLSACLEWHIERIGGSHGIGPEPV